MKVHTDASTYGLGAIIYQLQDDKKRVIAFASRSLSRFEKNYSAFLLEFLALKWAITIKFSDYLLNNKFYSLHRQQPINICLIISET
jgi:hypothetical protein